MFDDDNFYRSSSDSDDLMINEFSETSEEDSDDSKKKQANDLDISIDSIQIEIDEQIIYEDNKRASREKATNGLKKGNESIDDFASVGSKALSEK